MEARCRKGDVVVGIGGGRGGGRDGGVGGSGRDGGDGGGGGVKMVLVKW